MATLTYRALDANGNPLMGRGQANFLNMAKSKEDALTENETLEIKAFPDLEHIMRLLKARAARLVG